MISLGEIHKEIGSRSAFQVDAPVVRFEMSIDRLRAINGKSLQTTKMQIAAFLGSKSRIVRCLTATATQHGMAARSHYAKVALN